jgi:LacI family transcriptional regulator
MTRPPTMQDVADAAGVSRMTVSLALRNSPRVSSTTADRIRRAAASLEYRPDPMVQRLTTHLGQRKKKESGLAIAWINAWKDRNGWRKVAPFVSLYEGAQKAAQKHGFHLEEFWLRQPGMNGKKLSRILYQRGIEHVIVGPLPRGNGHLSMVWEHFSLVTLGYSMAAPQLNRVVNHQLHSIRTAIRSLGRLGCRRIALCIDAAHDDRVDHSWTTGLAQHQAQIPAERRVASWVAPRLTKVWDEQAIARWAKEAKPDAILTHYYQLPRILEESGWRGRKPLVAMLDWPGGAPEQPGIDQRHEETGKAAVELVISQANHNERGLPAVPKALMVEGRWVSGGA